MHCLAHKGMPVCQAICLPVSSRMMYCTGSLPSSWATTGAFPLLELLNISRNALSGTLVTEWGHDAFSMPSLRDLDLGSNRLLGLMPRAWGVGFQACAALWTLPVEVGRHALDASCVSQLLINH